MSQNPLVDVLKACRLLRSPMKLPALNKLWNWLKTLTLRICLACIWILDDACE
ncbi:hypothetical protein [Almyronema epifaneia]|uniref:Uncharacterized protein n=1 Tax=Almyronema epifaneia S1 TaxID=2991925 RepID=A0ABW6IKC7_9CYAN